MTMVRVRDGAIRNNVIAFSMGEGIDLDKGSYRLIAEATSSIPAITSTSTSTVLSTP